MATINEGFSEIKGENPTKKIHNSEEDFSQIMDQPLL